MSHSIVETLPVHASAGCAYARVLELSREFCIGNALVERRLRYDPIGGLSTVSWRHKPTGTEFLETFDAANQPAPEVSFCVNGDAYRLAASRSGARGEFRLLEAWALEVERAGVELHLRFETRTYALEVELIYTVYDGFAVIRKRVAITNRSS